MTLEEVPKPPENDFVKYSGDPPYQNNGYAIDSMINGEMHRWRYDDKGLKGYILYGKESLIPWQKAWFRE